MTIWTYFGARAIPLSLLPAVLLACSPATTAGVASSQPTRPASSAAGQSAPADSARAAAAIAPRLVAWADAYERRDAAALADFYTVDGLYAANTGELLRGRAGIRQGVSAWFARHPRMLASLGFSGEARLDLSVDQVKFRAAGDLAHSVLRFVIRVVPAGCVLDAGYAAVSWRREADGQWRIDAQVVNQDREPPPGACARP